MLWNCTADIKLEKETIQSTFAGIVESVSYRKKKGGSYEIIHGVIGPMNHQGGLRGGQTRRAINSINKNIIGAFSLNEKIGFCNKILHVPLHRPITWSVNFIDDLIHKICRCLPFVLYLTCIGSIDKWVKRCFKVKDSQ